MMSIRYALLSLILLLPLSGIASENPELKKTNIAVVSSYHPEYIWSQMTNDGVLTALLEFGYLDNRKQGEEYTRTNRVESSRIVLQKYWMDTKRQNSPQQIARTLARITEKLATFKPDLVLLGDDNAANYVGNHYLDSKIPVVFWGVNGVPLKYGLLDSLQRPGHNVTGIYQAGYHREGVKQLQKLIPGIKRIAVLSDDSATGRPNAKKVQRYGMQGELGAEVVKVVITNSFEIWQKEALAIQDQVDAFFISTHNTLRDKNRNHVNYLDVTKWYLKNIHKPEIVTAAFGVKEGFLATVDDSAFNQGYEAMKVAHSILSDGKNPAEITSYAPAQGDFIVNSWRAEMLGLGDQIKEHADIIDQLIDEHMAWQ
jgi:ABC-type uncharacterized transport system substrate-binding protein